MSKNVALDGIKSILAILIVLYHIYLNFFINSEDFKYLRGCFLAVDAFFILSGYLMAVSFEKRIIKGGSYSTISRYAKDRFFRLFPEYSFVLMLSLALLPEVDWHILIPNLFLIANLNGIGSIVRDAWFISSLFYVSVFLFGICRYVNSDLRRYFVGVLLIISYAILTTRFYNIGVHSGAFYGIFTGSVYRTVFGLCIGILIYDLRFCFNKLPELLVYIIEIVALVLCIKHLSRDYVSIVNANFAVFFSIIALLLIQKRGLLYRLVSAKIFIVLSQSSYMLFLSHLLVIDIIARYFHCVLDIMPGYLSLLFILVVCVSIAVVLKFVSDRYWKFLNSFIKNGV